MSDNLLRTETTAVAIQDSKDNKESQDSKESQDNKENVGTKENQDSKDDKGDKDNKDDKDNYGVYTHKFKEPFEYENKKYEEITFYFEKLTGKDVIAIETEMQANNEYALAPEISRIFQCKMASKAGSIGSDVLEALPMRDFNAITHAARRFLASTLGE